MDRLSEGGQDSYGMDVGWESTACVWLAFARENGVTYAYREYQRGRQAPDVHANEPIDVIKLSRRC